MVGITPQRHRVAENIQVSLRVRNLAPSARDLVVMFTEDAAYPGQLLFESNAPGGSGSGVGAGVTIETGDEEDGAVRDVSPAVCGKLLYLHVTLRLV